ncbi:hypothetical protein PMIN04_002215 [Paraphaeosphaeria minitans]|uniref:Uncharacterized protein n=1 Tax=Paraphaeosphaeria minitans TaxID=565426 RepID=A0A9P6GNX4_9PLEO|nr:hypothetical protein PMIN01_01786 [Paraphaeosphaeria minitans]
MRSLLLGIVSVLVGMALGHPGTNPDIAQVSGSGGVFACTMPQWSHGCKYFPQAADNACHNADLYNDVGGQVFEIYAFGPDPGTKCRTFAQANCVGPFYAKKDTPPKDWTITYPGAAETSSAIRSFMCYPD